MTGRRGTAGWRAGALTAGLAVALLGVRAARAADSAPAASSPAPIGDADARCAAIARRMAGLWPDATTRITTAEFRPAGSPAPAAQFGAPKAGPLPEHCEIKAVMHERVGAEGARYAIGFHLRLPSAWNGRFFFSGGGGTDGNLGDALGYTAPDKPAALNLGYAVVSQDAGHDNAVDTVPARGGMAAFGFDPIARADYGYASLKPVADAAQAAVKAYYGHGPARSYFVGCSKGGQEGMVFAQRYPAEFDGIVAGAPGFALPRAAVAEAWDTQAFAALITGPPTVAALARTFSDSDLALARNAVLEACDALDGVKDGLVSAVGQCTLARVELKLKAVTCAQDKASACLAPAQAQALLKVLGGAKDSSGRALYADWPLDGGLGAAGWRIWKIGVDGGPPAFNVVLGGISLPSVFTTPPTPVAAAPEAILAYILGFDFDRDAPKIYAVAAPYARSAWEDISARDSDLSAFAAHGGKLIVPQGVSDPVFSLNDTLAWYDQVQAREHGRAGRFARVFPVPGMGHCFGGPATDHYDAFQALVDWVETDRPPDRIIAAAGPASPWPGRTRPLCPWPKTARYDGHGDVEKAESFVCS